MSKCNAGYCGCQGELVDVATMRGVLELHQTPPDYQKGDMWFAFKGKDTYIWDGERWTMIIPFNSTLAS